MTRTYDRATVEALLPILWDEHLPSGLAQELMPDPTMPRARVNPAHGNTLVAMIADVQRAWSACGLTIKEKRALCLYYGLGWTQEDIAFNQGVMTHHAISKRIDRAVGRITAWLNGETTQQDEEHEDDDSVHV